MSLFAIGDPHLSFGCQKPMDIFKGWENHAVRLEKNWKDTVEKEDTVVLPGDISWAMNFEELLPDFQFLHSLPGKKVILKGNHDYWWATRNKMDQFLLRNGLDSIEVLHNSCICAEGFRLCGTRGWLFENGQPHDEKVLAREAGRLRISLEAAKEKEGELLVFLHYPPIFGQEVNLPFWKHYWNLMFVGCIMGTFMQADALMRSMVFIKELIFGSFPVIFYILIR